MGLNKLFNEDSLWPLYTIGGRAKRNQQGDQQELELWRGSTAKIIAPQQTSGDQLPASDLLPAPPIG